MRNIKEARGNIGDGVGEPEQSPCPRQLKSKLLGEARAVLELDSLGQKEGDTLTKRRKAE